MKLQDLFENRELGVRFRIDGNTGRVRVTYGNRGVDIYQTKPTASGGTVFEPLTPWEVDPLVSQNKDPQAAWHEVQKKIEDHIVSHFRSGTRDARSIGKKLQMWH